MDTITLLAPALFLVFILAAALFNIRSQTKEIRYLLARTSAKLEVSEEELRLVASTFDSHEPIVITNENLNIIRINDAFISTTGYLADEAVEQDFLFLSASQLPDQREDIMNTLASRGHYSGELSCRHRDGREFPMYLRITAIKDADGATTHHVAVYSDISEQKRNEELINNLAFYDPLTGLPNRRKIMDSMERELYRSSRYKLSGSLFFVDVDNFKNINDTLGHDHGDHLLIELGQRLCSHLRKSDIVARIGGDEFLVLLQSEAVDEQHTVDHAASIANKLLSLHKEPYFIDGHKHFVSISIGITTFPGHASEPQELLKQADTALYRAKSMGRNGSCFFHPDMQKQAERKRAIEHNLREALANNEFELHYQPQVTQDGDIHSLEALIRWQSPETGYIAPSDFINIAEDSGLIIPLGNWILREACQQMKTWQMEGFRLSHVAVNVSPRQFGDENFIAQVESTLKEVGLPAESLMIELTESVVVDNIEDTKAKMEALQQLGVRISMDDFGTGYSSLSYLSELPFHELKIDQSFIRNLFNDEKNSEIASTIIAMAKSLNLIVLAEGVEDHEQLQFLRTRECSMYQGYYFSKPLASADLAEVLRRQPEHAHIQH